MQTTKPGFKTTEFYVTVTTAISGMLMAFGILDTETSEILVRSIQQLAGGAIALGSVISYVWSRTKTKITADELETASSYTPPPVA